MKKVIVATKIVYDLEETPFFVDIENIRFYFSSKFQMDKFKRDYPKRIESMFFRLKPYIGETGINEFKQDLTKRCIIESYTQSEPRGSKFHIINEDEVENIDYV